MSKVTVNGCALVVVAALELGAVPAVSASERTACPRR